MFKATAFEFRFRFLLHSIIYLLGFTGPWNYAIHLDPPGPNAHLWGTLAANLSRAGVGNMIVCFNLVLSIAIACAFTGAFLRTWGSAYLGANIVQSHSMHTPQAVAAPGIVEDGPFRHCRNPLYLGTFLHTLALSILMPRSGAIFCVLAIGMLQIRLMLAEELFLLAKLGAPYVAYCALVPRMIPSLRPRIAAGGLEPRWPQAILGEIYMWGVACAFAFAGWRYNSWLLMQCVLVSLGASLVVRGFMQKSAVA